MIVESVEMWKFLVFITMASQRLILVIASDNQHTNTPTVTTTRIPTTSSQTVVTEGTCKPQQTKCTCICEVIPDEQPSTTTAWTLPTSESASSTKIDSTTTTQGTTSEQSNPCKKYSHRCPSRGNDHPEFIPLENCNAYCRCSNGEAYFKTCPDGLHFNPILEICDWPAKAGCGTNNTVSKSTPGSNSSTDCNEENKPSNDQNDCKIYESLCPKTDDDHPIYIPHPNCTAFCKCGNGRIFYRSCSAGLHFNPIEKVCDHPGNAKCTGLPPIPSDTCKSLTSYCPILDEDHPVYIPLSNCSAFCKCTNGEATYHPCPDGLHFNAKKNVCDWPGNAGCDRNN